MKGLNRLLLPYPSSSSSSRACHGTFIQDFSTVARVELV